MRGNFTKYLRAYFTLGIIGSIAGLVGIGSGLNSLFGGSSQQGGGSGPTSTTGAFNTISPEMLQAYQQWIMQNPQYAQGYQGAAGQAGQQYGQAGAADFGQGMAAINAGNAAEAAAVNPQTGLYNQLLQGTQDASAAGSSMRGIGTSPVAAGLENQATGQFNNQWNNSMVQNAATGAQALSGASVAGAGLMGTGAGSTLQGGATPYNAANNIAGQPFNIANAYTGSLNQSINPNLMNFNQGIYGNQQGAASAIGQGFGQLSNNTGFNSWLNGQFGGDGSTGTSFGGYPAGTPGQGGG
jgi:hypothetical protein